jgi:hypothetical protein
MFSLGIDWKSFSAGRRKSEMRDAIRGAMAAAAKEWHQEYYEGHFTAAGATKYGYFKRKGEGLPRGTKAFSRSYHGKKLKHMGHERPLVYTGESYQRGKVAKIVASSKQAKVVLPSTFNFKHPKSRINMREEVTRVLPEEVQHLRDIAEAEMARSAR